jgi:hypothetical protein
MADIEKEALAGMAKVGAPRQPSLREGTKFTSPSAKPASGKLVAKGNAAAGDPTAEAKPSRSTTTAERNGAAHTVITKIVKSNEPAAGATLANAKIIPSTIKRGGFAAGIDSAY